jgi:HEAT repeat protein
MQPLELQVAHGISPEIRAQSALSLGRIGDEGVLMSLKGAALNENEKANVRAAAAQAMGMLGAPQGAQYLEELADSREPLLRKY